MEKKNMGVKDMKKELREARKMESNQGPEYGLQKTSKELLTSFNCSFLLIVILEE